VETVQIGRLSQATGKLSTKAKEVSRKAFLSLKG
jgi:hypothetical protein